MTNETVKNYTHYKDFKSHEVKINDIDFSAIVMEFEIYQDIFSPFWTASMIISDGQNELMQNEILQGDRVNIKIEGKQGEANFKFIIYQIGDRQLVKQQHYVYQIQMIDEGFFKDQKERISKSYKNKKADQAAAEALGKIGGIKEKSTTDGKFSYIVPNLSPIATAEWLAKWAVASKSGAADIVVYQATGKSWNWLSLEEMFMKKKSTKLLKLVQRPGNLLDDQDNELPEYEFGIEEYKFTNHMNLIPNTVMGAFANTTLTHNLKTRKAKTNEFKYGDDVGADGGKKQPFKNINGMELANVSYQAIHPNNMDDGSQGYEEDHENWKGSRKSSLQKLDTNRLIVSIPGRIDIHTELGKYTNVELPSQQDKTEEEFDRQYKQRWLITAFRHVWTQKSFITIIELGKKRLA